MKEGQAAGQSCFRMPTSSRFILSISARCACSTSSLEDSCGAQGKGHGRGREAAGKDGEVGRRRRPAVRTAAHV